MQKKSYQKPEIKEVKLKMEDTLINACRARNTSTQWSRTGGQCRACRITYRPS